MIFFLRQRWTLLYLIRQKFLSQSFFLTLIAILNRKRKSVTTLNRKCQSLALRSLAVWCFLKFELPIYEVHVLYFSFYNSFLIFALNDF
uniref:Uncharacterized protein n=1 Tax=Octopus bimaculoides TaxID=37653 RepID=A0A0L8FN20_OCTBM